MPIHVPPISRRDFLKGSLIAGASALACGDAAAGLFGKSTDRDCFALLADTHLSADARAVSRGINMADNFAAVGRELATLARLPAGVLIAGDLALQRGEPGDYTTLVAALQPIRKQGLPVDLLLGNHDDRANFWSAFPREKAAKQPVPDHQAAIVRARRANWMLLDSLEVVAATPGAIGDAQCAWLASSLDAEPRKPALIVVHHNPQWDTGDAIGGLKDTERLFSVLAPRRQVKAVIFGHTHDWNVIRHESGIHLINLPPTAYVFREGRPSGWVRVTLERDGMVVELRCLDTKHPQHGERHALQWRQA